jgi:hypothetical protein
MKLIPLPHLFNVVELRGIQQHYEEFGEEDKTSMRWLPSKQSEGILRISDLES